MLGHLWKRCPGMTQQDRNHAFMQMQNTSSAPAKAKKQAIGNQTSARASAYSQPQMTSNVHPGLAQQTFSDDPIDRRQPIPHHMQGSMQPAPPANLPPHTLMQRQQSALDTLAEVSRRHFNYSVRRDDYVGEHQDAAAFGQSDRSLVEQALLAALQRQNPGVANTPGMNESNNMPMYSTYEPHAQAQVGAENAAFTTAAIPMPLVQTATAASQQLEQAPYHENVPSIDPQLAGKPVIAAENQGPPSHEESTTQSHADLSSWAEAPQEFVTQQDPPSNEPNPGFGLLQRTDKTNARARFTDIRRKEVQSIRKRGACMRCRMLKKPCSEGTPCDSCKKVDSARLWKGTCFRTKLAEEFTLYATSYFQSQAVAEVSDVVHPMGYAALPGRLEVKLVPDSAIAMTLSAKRSFGSNGQGFEQAVHPITAPQTSEETQAITLDDGMVSRKISNYCANPEIIDECVKTEGSAFVQATLREAISLLEDEKLQENSSSHKTETRTNHISPSVLLKNVIELWVETSFLVSTQPETLVLRYNAQTLASQDSQVVTWPDDAQQSSFSLGQGSSGYRTIRAQLLAATETTCHRLSKAVMNELERRLLQRQQVSAFATFISAIILLNCVERITAFYQALDPSFPEGAAAADPNIHPQSRPPGYPSSAPAPSTLWPQGPHFARLLTTLLRMRALPPKTTRTADGKLALLHEPSLPVRLNGVAVRDQQDENTAKAAKWLTTLALDVDELRAQRDGDAAGRGWEMRFVSEVLLGENMVA